MNMKLRLAVVATLLLTGCQTLPNRNDAVTDEQQTAQTVNKTRSAIDRSASEQSRISVWRHASNEMKMEIPNRAEVIAYRDWYLQHPRYLNTVTQRAEPYLYLVMQEIEKRNMPMELVLLPVVESAYNPNARSPSNATGLWQFTAGTGRRYGLEQNRWYDGRRDIQASTTAAMDYLQKLSDDFDGNWFHAIAAYNVGEGRIQKAVEQSRRAGKNGDFWSLNLPRQTTEYVPRLLALADIIKNADRYGVKLPNHPNKQQWQRIDAGGPVSLAVVADLAGLEGCRRFQLCHDAGVEPNAPRVWWLQSLDQPDLTFSVTDPANLGVRYVLELSDEQAAALKLQRAEDAVVLSDNLAANLLLDHFGAEQAVGTPGVRLAGFFGEGRRLSLAPGQAHP